MERPLKRYYAYIGKEPLGSERLGTQGKILFESALSESRVISKVRRWFGDNEFSLYIYSNFYDDKTFRKII